MSPLQKLTHLNDVGEAHMVDVGEKDITARIAIAQGFIAMKPETLQIILAGDSKKGDVIATARIAGIMAAKKTSDLIPLCHPIALDKVTIDIEPDLEECGLWVRATAKTSGKTGVEMEALSAACVTCLTIYDMAKAVDKGMIIKEVKLLEKMGGKSGHFKADS